MEENNSREATLMKGMNQYKVEKRLRKYLERDVEGVRKNLLRIFLQGDRFTIGDVFNMLSNSTNSNLSMRGVSAMVGLMSSRLGILNTELGDKNRYFIKSEYEELVKSILGEFERRN